jgi:hypothetical protein
VKRTAAPLAITLALACVPASAQIPQDQLAQQQTPTAVPTQAPGEVERGETVMSRARPDYDPIGLRLGGFLLYPELAVQESYSSNIFATSTNERSDFITAIEPSLNLKSNWNNHALNFKADAQILKYADHSSEDQDNYSFGTDGRLDIQRDSRVYGGATYAVRHESRYSPNDLGAREPTKYDVFSANLSPEKDFNRLSVRLDGNLDRFSYSNATSGAGATILEDQRDRTEYQIGIKPTYELAPLRQIYGLFAYNWRDYDSNSSFGFNRDSTGFTLAVGARYDITGILFADVYLGYREQDYDDPRLPAAQGPAGGAKLTWNVTRLTTVTGLVTREIQETILAGSSSYFATKAEARVDHELLRNLILNGSLGYENDDFEGINRNDNFVVLGLGAKYLINRNFALSGGYSFRTRSSDAADVDFDEHITFLRLSSHL